MVDYNNLFGSMAGLAEQWHANSLMQAATDVQINNIRASGQIAAQGALLSASGYRESAKALEPALMFNLEIDSMNHQRQLDAMGRQASRILSKQTAQVAQAGISVGSKSALMMRNEVVNNLSTQVLYSSIDTENKRRAEIFGKNMQVYTLEGQAINAENQANIATWQAEVSAVNARNQQAISSYQSNQKVMSGIPSILGQLFQE